MAHLHIYAMAHLHIMYMIWPIYILCIWFGPFTNNVYGMAYLGPFTYKVYGMANLRIYEPAHDKTYNKTSVTSKDSDQPVHPPCMAKVFIYPSLGSLEAVECTCD